MNSLLVVCRYNEDLSWVNKISQNYIIFNKGNDIDYPNSIKQTNISREEYTYLKYIVDNYYSLPDRVIFSQAEPIQHSPDFLDLLRYENLFSIVQPLSDRYNHCHPIPAIRPITFPYLNINSFSIHSDFYDYRLSIYAKDYTYYSGHWRLRQIFRRIFKQKNIRKLVMDAVGITPRLFNNKEISPFNYSAIFAVNKEAILNRSLKFYQNLLDKSISGKIPLFPFIMELSWMEIFEYEPPPELYP